MQGNTKPEDLPYPPGVGILMPQLRYPDQGEGEMGFEKGPQGIPNNDRYGNRTPNQLGGPTYQTQGRGYYGPQQGAGYGYPQQAPGYGYPAQGGGYGYPVQGGGYGYPVQGAYPHGGGYPPTGQIPSANQMGPYRSGQHQSQDYSSDTFEGFTDQQVRRNFVKKVYTILAVLLAITAAIIAPFLYVDAVQEFAVDHMFILIICLVLYIVLMIALVCCESIRRSFPINFIMLLLLTLVLGIMCGFITIRFSTTIVLIAFGMTAMICVIITLVACFVPIDITGCGALMCILAIGLSLFGCISALLVIFFNLKFITLIYSAAAVVIFSLYLLFDTQQIMGGKRVELSPEEYILGALQLYVDVIQIFINLLPLVAACFSNE